MFDNICSLPLTSDLFAQAIHPSRPLLSVGLSSGHVQTYNLPATSHQDEVARPLKTSVAHQSGVATSRRSSENGFGTVDTAWRTRRHKGSCRSLVFSTDGEILFSAGTDGLLKAATTETGRVVAKVAIPVDSFASEGLATAVDISDNILADAGRPPPSLSQNSDAPSILQPLSPQALLLGTDTGHIHLYDLRASLPATGPQQSLRPHATSYDPKASEPITSLTPLAPSTASTSGTSKQWISISGATLAVSDLRKGVVKVSGDQGDVLLSSAIAGVVGLSANARKRKLNGNAHAEEKVVVGGANGVLTLWSRGRWGDQEGRVVVHRDGGGVGDEGTLDCLALAPERDGNRGKVVATGMGNGLIRFVGLRGGGGEVIGEVSHDEMRVEGVAALGFDVAGRMISGGGQVVKVWHQLGEDDIDGLQEDQNDLNGLLPLTNDGIHEGQDEDSTDEDAENTDAEEVSQAKKKRRKQKGSPGEYGDHGIRAYEGLD